MSTKGLPKFSRRVGAVLGLLTLTLLGSSCGTRVDGSAAGVPGGEPATASASTAYPVPGTQVSGATDASSGSTTEANSSGTAVPPAGTPVAAASSPGRTGTAGGSTAGAAQTSSPTTPGAPVPGSATPKTPSAGGAGGAATPGASPSTDDGKKSPLIVATMCNCSGPAGSSTVPMVQASQVWVKLINSRGGLNGHPVKQILYDDGSDPARNRAQVREAVEREKALAFFMEAAPLSARASVEYITSKGIPVVGTNTADYWDYESPMYFPQSSADRPGAYASVAGAAQQLVPAGKTKLAQVYCAEAEQCARINKFWVEFAPKLGFQVVYEAPVSLAQPDFTAVCLSARNAGAQVVAVLADTNTVSRVAASCSRQGFRPAITGQSQTVANRFSDDPNMESYVGASTLFPFFQTGTPATDEYHQALRTHGGGVASGMGTTLGWVAGKLLEKAGANLPEPPTSQAILEGLWSLRNDDLGGLTQPLAFVRGQTAPKIACWFAIASKDSKWISPDGFQRQCAPGPVN